MPRRAISFVWFVTVFFLLSLSAMGKTIHVPADQPTIQAGINAAVSGDTVLVSAGTYYENINFNGKAITVTSASGPAATVIDGSKGNSPAVLFSSNEKLSSVISGFTTPERKSRGRLHLRSKSYDFWKCGHQYQFELWALGDLCDFGRWLITRESHHQHLRGINSDFDTGLQIVGNVIVGVNGTAVSLYGSEGTEVVQQNSILENGSIGIYYYPFSGNGAFSQNVIIGNKSTGVRLGGGYRSAHRRQQHHC